MLLGSIAHLLLTSVLLHLPLTLSREVHTTSSGGICISPCQRHDTEYFWCKQKGGSNSRWDYCSPKEEYDSYERKCLSGCQDIMDSGYEKCFTIKGWSYCGHIIQEFQYQFNSHYIRCDSDCYFTGKYFKCVDIHENEFSCSPLNHVTATGEPCREDHPCDTHGYTYTWCYTDYSQNWDYCGKVVSDCAGYNRRIGGTRDDVVCKIADLQNKIEWEMASVSLSDTELSKPSQSHFYDAVKLIYTFDYNICYTNRNRTVAFSKNIRMDMQSTNAHDGIRYMDLQLHLNEPRLTSSTSIAKIIFPRDLDTATYSEYIKKALHISLVTAYEEKPVKIKIIHT